MIGVIAAFGASFTWTYACFIWRSQANKYESLDINFSKNLIALIIFAPWFITFDSYKDFRTLILLFLSGIIGIGLGDTFYIKSLNLIGTRKTLSIEALSPLLAAFSGNLFINETLSPTNWLGIIIISFSLLIIIKEKGNLINKNSELIPKRFKLSNYLYGFLSVFCAVAAALLSRLVFLESDVSPIHTTEIRLFSAIIFLILITKFKIKIIIKELSNKEKRIFLLSVILGTNLGIFLQQIVFQTLPVGIGWTLLSTSPIISLLFAKKEEGEISQNIIIFTFALFFGLILVIF